jgi:HSP20 family protein
MDLIEAKDNQVVARFELPGMSKEEVNVEVRNDRLTISGNKKPETNEGRFAVRERPFGRFARTLQLPEGTKVLLHMILSLK